MKAILRAIILLLLLLHGLSIKAVDGRTFQVMNASDGLADNSAQVVVCTKTGRMIISTMGNLNFYNGVNFKHITTHNSYQSQLPNYSGGYHLYFDRRHHIWLKNDYRLTCVDLIMEKFIMNVDSVVREMGCQDPLKDLFVDSVGSVWFLTEKGLYGVENQLTYTILRDHNLQDLDVFDDMLLTFYDNGSEMGQNLASGRTVHRTRAYDGDKLERYNQKSFILRYKDGYFQVRTGEKESVFLYFDVKELKWTLIDSFPFLVNHISLHEDRIFLPSEQGFGIYDIEKQQMEWINNVELNNGRKVQINCNMITFDRQDGMWIGTEGRGVLYARPTKLQFHAYSWDDPKATYYSEMLEDVDQNITEFLGQRANCLFMDSRGWSWIGTTSGLYLYKKPQSEPIIFSRKNGLYNNVVHTVVEDKRHNIWAATSSGISFVRFNAGEVEFVNSFNTIDGVPSESFVNCKGKLLDDGRIVMQSTDHVVVFSPDDLEEVNTPHPYKLFPKLVGLMVNGNNIGPETKINDVPIVDRALSRTWEISVSSNESSMSLTFSPLNYYRPLQSYYKVRIKGVKEYDDWRVFSYFNSDGRVDSKGMLHVPLTGLEPGTYELELLASMYPDQWDGYPFTWKLIVRQSWWQTTGILWIMIALISVLVLVNIGFYLRNESMRMHRNHGEGDMIRKIRQFVDRCNTYNSEVLAPITDDFRNDMDSSEMKLTPEFMEVMTRIMPYVQEHMKGELTMAQLSKVAEMDVVSLYELMMGDIYKSPRDLARTERLQRVADLLIHSDKTIGQIADECGFQTPNYLMGTFFHQYKQTPSEYRESHS